MINSTKQMAPGRSGPVGERAPGGRSYYDYMPLTAVFTFAATLGETQAVHFAS